jgi:ArsR family transcriptional regulator
MPFGDEFEFERATEVEQAAHDCRRLVAITDGAHEGSVDLQDVDREPAEIARGRPTGSEVVDRRSQGPRTTIRLSYRSIGSSYDDIFRYPGFMSDQPAAVSAPIFEIKAELFRALGHPARVRALEVLAEGERSVGELAGEVGIEASHLSQQLGILRRAGLVATRKEGSTVFYAIRDPQLVELLAVARRLLISSLTHTRSLLAGLESTVDEEKRS